MAVCVIIPMYNFNEMTKRCIDFVIQNSGIDNEYSYGYHIVVVDDGSDIPFDDDRVEVIRNDVNKGFTASVNTAINEYLTEFKYFMILNNDTEPEPGFLRELVNVMEKDKDIAIASSVRKVPQNGEGSYELGGIDWIRGHTLLSWNKETEVKQYEWVPFCSVIIRKCVISEIGLLDKRMINYCSDNDYCSRVTMAGYKIVVVPDSEVKHYRGVTIIENKDKLKLENDQKIFLEKLSGLQWQTLLDKLPLDIEQNIWGQVSFETYKKSLQKV